MRHLIFTIIALSLTGIVRAQTKIMTQQATLTKLQQLNQLFAEYNKRFVNKKYISNPRQIQDFNIRQDALAASLKQSRNLVPALFITNDFESDLTVKIFLFIDESNKLLGLYYEKSKYYDEEERSYLRFVTLEALATGLRFIPVNGTHALIVKGHYFSAEKGGTLQFNYLKDVRNQSWGATNLFLLNRGQGWGAFNMQYQPIQNANVRTWTQFLNGGVTDITLY